MSDWNTVTSGYQRKTIEKIINRKLDSWIKTIDLENKEEIKNSIIVTGGAIVNLLVGIQPNDFDIYFSDSNVAKQVAEYYLKDLMKTSDGNGMVSRIGVSQTGQGLRLMIKSAGVAGPENPETGYEYFELSGNDPSRYFDKTVFKNNLRKAKNKEGQYLLLLATDNAISLSDDVQLITRFVGNPEKIHENFDFEHTKSYWTSSTGLVINHQSLELIMSRTLKYTGSMFPLCSMFRLRKFLKRGWSITAGEMLKISYDISKLDLNDINVLREQLIGVDCAYFMQLIELLEKEYKEDLTTISRTYIINLIDRVFSGDISTEENEIIDSILEND